MSTRKLLIWTLGMNLLLPLLCVIIYETELLQAGLLAEEKGLEFLFATSMELITLCMIPLALRLFKFRKVSNDLKARGERALQVWGILRIDMLCLPLFLNTLFYYLFLYTAFGYMAIILLLCLCFIIPTKARCEAEIH